MNTTEDNLMPSLEEAVNRYLNTYARLYRSYCRTVVACIASAVIPAGVILLLAVPGPAAPLTFKLTMIVLFVVNLLLFWMLLRTILQQRTVLRQLESWTREAAV
ncbi:hypothetical protein O0S10_01580 [Methanocorpusculum sp. MG]|uniref:Uncharacterized protein n=1 Tax=Methanocorpusculum petauri TaxID=3002863 RepID=A0ABT4IF76_9EURY|nr:hypothetical protein [Methanocorpusculum petauri]MCZ0859917.1 hypothetical protein [Methanocorpusculum petauri]